MKWLSTKSLIAMGSSVVLATLAAQALSTATRGLAVDEATQKLAQYCAPHEDGEIQAQDVFC
ncbi:MAG TPA: hypothetical protein VGH39_09835 [Xanthobacteraceae bacterium]|jgi:hypothetical protein